MTTTDLRCYYGHHKCASSWFRRIFEDAARWTGRRSDGFDNPIQFAHNLSEHIRSHQLEMVSFTNADWTHIRPLGEHRAVHLIRDPRDVLVSAYFSHRYSHSTEGWPELIPHRQRLEGLNEADGLLAELEFSECYLRQMHEWNYGAPGVMELKFEQLTRTPYESCLEAFEHLGLLRDEDCTPLRRVRDACRTFNLSLRRRIGSAWPLPIRCDQLPSYQLLLLVHQQRYRKLSGGRKQGQANAKSHYRSGKAGDWKHHFTPAVQSAFDARYPGIVQRLGYTD